MKIVRENIDFERGDNYHKSLKVGKYSQDPTYTDFIDGIKYDYEEIKSGAHKLYKYGTPTWFVFSIDSKEFGANSGRFSFTLKDDEETGKPQLLLWDTGSGGGLATIVRDLDHESDINAVIKEEGEEAAELLHLKPPGTYLGEDIEFERGKNPKHAMGIGIVNQIVEKWNELQHTPGTGSLNLKIMDAELNLEIYVSHMPGSVGRGIKNVEETFGKEFFKNGGASILKGPNLYFTIKDEYADLFQKAYRQIYSVFLNEDDGWDFERGQVDPRDAMGIGLVHRISKGLKTIHNNPKFGQFSLLRDIDPEWLDGSKMGIQFRIYMSPDRALQVMYEAFGDDLEPFGGFFSSGDDYAILTVKKQWMDIVSKAYKKFYGLKEEIDFERGRDPKEAMGIGLKKKLWDSMYHAFQDHDLYGSMDNFQVVDSVKFGVNTIHILKNDLSFRRRTPYFYIIETEDREIADFQELYFSFKEDALTHAKDMMKQNSLVESIDFERGKDPKDALKIGIKERLRDEAFSLKSGWTPGEVKRISSIMGIDAEDIYQLGFAGEWDYDKYEFNEWTQKLDDLTPIKGAFKKEIYKKDGYYFYNFPMGKIAKVYLDGEGIYWYGDAAAAINLGLVDIPRDERESMR